MYTGKKEASCRSRKEPNHLAPGSQTSDLQNCEGINAYCLSPGLWSFVVAAQANRDAWGRATLLHPPRRGPPRKSREEGDESREKLRGATDETDPYRGALPLSSRKRGEANTLKVQSRRSPEEEHVGTETETQTLSVCHLTF